MRHEKILTLLFIIIVVLVACEKTMPPSPEEFELLDGPIEGLSTEENARFLKGAEAFGEVFTVEKGMGPFLLLINVRVVIQGMEKELLSFVLRDLVKATPWVIYS